MTEERIDELGKLYGRLRVREFAGNNERGQATWKCSCECGNTKVITGALLRNGTTRSCGCLATDFGKNRTMVGNFEVKITKDILKEMRVYVLSTATKLKQKEQVEELLKRFPQFRPKTIPAYINACTVSDRVFQMYLDDKISLGVIRELGGCETTELSDFLADEMVERGMTTGQLETSRSLMRNGRVKSWDEAFKEAMGQVVHEIKPPPPKRNKYQIEAEKAGPVPQSFDQLLEDILISGTNWRMKVQMAIDMASFVPEAGGHHFTVFNKIYMLRHILKENYEFVDKKVKEYLDAMLQMGNVAQGNGSDAAKAAKENEQHGGHTDGTGVAGSDFGGEVEGSEGEPEGLGPDLPSSCTRIVEGEGRVRS